MSLLKSLEVEAERRRQELAAEAERRRHRQQAYEAQVLPALRRLLAYLEQIIARLNAIDGDRRLDYTVPDYGRLQARIAPRYRVQLDERVRSAELTLEGEAEILTALCPEIAVDGLARVRQLMTLFEQAGVNGFQKGSRDVRGQWVEASFKPRGPLPLKFVLLAEPGNDELRLTLCGFESLAVIQKKIPTAALDDALFDQIGRYVAGLDHDLSREQLPESIRDALQHRLREEAEQRRLEEERVQQRLREEEAERRAIEEQKLHRRARRLLLQGLERVRNHPKIAALLHRLQRKP